jgi:hypothetical protein
MLQTFMPDSSPEAIGWASYHQQAGDVNSFAGEARLILRSGFGVA